MRCIARAVLVSSAGFLAAAVLAPAAVAQTTQSSSSSRAVAVVTPQQLVDKAMKAMGGAERINAMQSLSHTAKMPGPGAEITVQAIFPTHLRIDMELGEMGSAVACKTAEHAWSRGPGEQYKLHDPEAEMGRVLGAAQITFCLTMLHYAADLEFAGTEDFNGAKCHRLEIDDKHKLMIKALMFDARTGLPAGMEIENEGMTAPVAFTKWKASENIQVVTELEFGGEMTGGSMTATYDNFVWNKVPQSAFEMPAEVKKLVEKAKQEKAAKDKDKG